MTIRVKHKVNCIGVIAILFFNCFLVDAQYCLEYPVIDGNPCGQCAPEGWDVVSDTPDILDPMNSFCNPFPSPTGGNVIHLWSNGVDHFEAVSSSFEIPDFIFGQEYYFGIYYSGCGSHPYTLSITINGEEYDFVPGDSWEYFELCLVPESPDVEIEIAVEAYFTGMPSSSMIDTGVCDNFYCCALDAEIEEDMIFLCPGEEEEIILNIINEVGDVEIEWSCDPLQGLDFLDDPNSANPILAIPFGDEDEESFLYTVRIEDEDCFIFREFEFTLNASEVPEFDIYLCELYEEYELPILSDEGYSGTWDGNFSWDELGGTVQEYTFTLNPGQDNCIQEWTYDYLIHYAETISFEMQTVYCIDDSTSYRLPKESEERIEGDWDDSKFSPHELGVGVHQFVFEIDREYYCAEDFTLEIEVISGQELEFDIQTIYCSSPDSIFLPDTSIQGIDGIWTQNIIDLNIAIDSQSIFFNSIDSMSCIADYELIYSVKGDALNSFDIPDTICRTESYIEFDSISLEGNMGYWTPVAVSFDTIISDFFEILWTPLDSIECLNSSSMVISLLEEQQAEFELPASLCFGSGVFELPTTSLNGLSGVWNTVEFDPDTVSSSGIDLSFTPDEACTEVFFWNISINNETLDLSDFDLDTVLCRNEAPFDLPLSSLSGINGQWSHATIDPMEIVDSLTVNFFPENNNNTCYDTLELKFFVSDIIEPLFDIPSLLCAKTDNYIFPDSSIEGILGTWDISEFNPGDLLGMDSLTNVFYPDDPLCYSEVLLSIALYDFSELDYTVSNPNSCIEPNGSIQLISLDDFELSMNNGMSWIESDRLEDLDDGDYSLLIRHLENLCLDTIMFSLESPESVRIIELQIDSITDCSMQGASVTCIAEGSDLEYSLNDSNLWTNDMFFDDLSNGQYWIYVRDVNAPDCIDSLMFNIEAFELTQLLDVISFDVSGCVQMDGSIEIIAQGQNLEYSINGALDWQIDPLFENLGYGIYDIIVRSMDSHDCFDEHQILINSPEIPTVEMINISNVSSCINSNGSIEIIATGTELEYSIDNGVNWTTTNLFSDLTAGDYVVEIREQNSPDCYTIIQANIDAPEQAEVLVADLQLSEDCTEPHAQLRLEMSISDLEFSIDNGVTWQTENLFMNLEEETYTVLIVDPLYPDCESSYEFEVTYPDCPCNTLNIEMEITPVDCLNPSSGEVVIVSVSGNIIDGNLLVEWDDGSSGFEIDGLTEGWSVYTISYDKNCKLVDSVYIDSFDPLSFDLLTYDQDCQDLGSIEIVNITGGAGEASYSIDGINFQENTSFTGLSAQEYQILIEDLFNCSGEDTAIINDISDLQVDLPGVDPISEGESTFLNPLINEASIDSFEWYPINGILNMGSLVAQVSPEETTDYTLTIYFGQCVEIRTVTVEVVKEDVVYLGNIFSPNGDGSNDTFYPMGNMSSNIIVDEMKIYDRWGNLLFSNIDIELNNPNQGWDGRHNGSEVEIGVYVYTIILNLNGKRITRIGNITLSR